MKIKLLVASLDESYVNHLTDVLSETYFEEFEVSVCKSLASLQQTQKKYDVLLTDEEFANSISCENYKVVFKFYDNFEGEASENGDKLVMHKYQRISKIVSKILSSCADFYGNSVKLNDNKANVTVVWSPIGGSGKTTVALAYAMRKSLESKSPLYLSLEKFSSVSTYFDSSNSSISSVFQRMNSNLDVVIKSAKQVDSSTSIAYFGEPQNYDDMNQIESEDLEKIIDACKLNCQELVVDLTSECDEKTYAVMEKADKILVVTNTNENVKLKQFQTQHWVWTKIKDKVIIVANKGSSVEGDGNFVINLPQIKSNDEINIYKTLSAESFER